MMGEEDREARDALARSHPLAVLIREALNDHLRGASRQTEDAATFIARRVVSAYFKPEGVNGELLAALKDTTAQLERILNMMGLDHDHVAETILYRGKDAIERAAALQSTPPTSTGSRNTTDERPEGERS